MSYVWEQRKLEDEVFSIDTGKSKFTSHESGKFEILGSTSVIGYDDSYDYEGDFLLTARVGANAGELYRHFGKVKISDNTVFIQGKYLDFIYYLLLNFGIKKLSFGTGQPLVKASELRKLNILMPINDNEREQIGLYLSKLDNLITLHQRKILLYKYFLTIVWEQRKFDEVFDCTIPNNTLSRAELNYENGSVKNIHYGDILIRYGSIVDVQNDEIPFATGKSSDDFKGALLQDGDIVIADTAEDETTGKACEIGNSQGVNVVSGLHTMVCRPRNKMASGYLGYYLNSDAYHHQLLPLMQGIKVLSLSKTNVQKTMVCYPKRESEQQLIADYFRNLDNLITLHRCKRIVYRKNMVNAWEQRKLGDTLVELKSGLSRMLSNNDIGLPVIRANNINEGYLNMETDIKYWYEKDPQGADINNYLVSKGDILINFINSEAKMGTATVVQKVLNRKTIYTTNILKARVDENYDKYFWFTLTLTDKYKNDIKIITKPAVNQASFTTVDFKKLSYLFPNLKEQQKIGNYFSNLDRLITLHQWKCIVCAKIKVNTSIQCKLIKIGVKLQKCILLSIILLFKRRKVSCVFYVNILLRFIKVIELEIELVFVIIDGTIIVMFYLKIRCLYLNIFIFKINK